jgi:hypothetical protein
VEAVMKKLIIVAAVILAAVPAQAPAQDSSKGVSLYCEIDLKPEGKNGSQHPFPLSNLKDGDRVRLGTNEMGPDIEVDVSYDDSDGYPAITIEESEANNPRSLSAEGSVQHPLELTDIDSKGNSRSVRCQPPAQ